MTVRTVLRALVMVLGSCGVASEAAPSIGAAKDRAGEIVGAPWVGSMGVTETVAQIMAREAALSPAEREEAERPVIRARYINPAPQDDPGGLVSATWPPRGQGDPLDWTRGGPLLPQTVALSVLGSFTSESSGFPPDSMGAIGPTQFFVTVNGRFKTLNKTTGVADGAINTTPNTFFTSVRNGSSMSDPRVRFDRITNRWFVVMINVSTPNRVCIAVSSGPTITNTSSFTFFFFTHDATGGGTSDAGGLFDYPSLGVDANALYIGGNVFNSSGTALIGPTGHVVRKSSVTGGGPIVVTSFRQLAVGSAGIQTPMGVDNDDPAATEGYFIGTSNSTTQLRVRRVSTPGGTPTISGDIAVTIPVIASPTNVSVLGSTSPLDALDTRLFNARICHNTIDNSRTLWTSHSIRCDASGNGSSGGGRDGTRWYQIGNMTGTPSLVQSGTLFDPAGTNIKNYWIGSVVMSEQGHMALGCTYAGTADRAGVAVAGRLRTDSLGSTQAPTLAVTSSTNYNTGLQGTRYRWGDYSYTSVDPNDGMTLWTIQEYCNATNSWGDQVIKLLAPAPATPVSCSPSTIAQGATANITVTGNSVSGTEFFDGGSGFPSRIAAAFSGSGLTVNSISFDSPTQLTLNVTAGGAAPTGARDLTVTNPDGQTASSAGGILTVTSAPPPPPGAFNLSSPGNGATGVSLTPTLTWTVSANAATYTVTIANDAGLSSVVLTQSGVVGTSFNVPAATLNTNQTYFWGVTAVNGGGSTDSTPFSFSFTTAPPPPPGAFNLTSPSNGATGVSLTPTLTWSSASGAVSYSATVATDPGLTNVVVSQSGIVGNAYNVPAATLSNSTTYYWGVTASNLGGGTGSTPLSFSFTTLSPPCTGDINGDGQRNTADLTILLGSFGTAVPPGTLGDLDGNGFVNTADLLILLGVFGVPC